MMSNNDLEILYKANLPESHAAGLRGIFDAGVGYGQGLSAPAQGDISMTVTEAQAALVEPVNINTP